MITTVVFDLDDTLYDEIDYCKSGFSAVAEFLSNLPKAPPAQRISDALWQQFASGNRTRTFNATLDELSFSYDDKLIARLIEVYRNNYPKITLPQDSRDVLNELKTKYTLALLTDGFLPAQKLKVQALEIENFFQCIIYTEELGRQYWKPSPAGFEKIMQTLKVKPDNIVYIADNEKKDFIAPNKLGFSTIQLIRPARIHACKGLEPDAAAQHTIGQISRLPDLLKNI